MIRGVKKQVIEVLNTENEYFEKAILVVSDRYIECDRARLRRKAAEYVSSITPFSVSEENVKAKKRVNIMKKVFCALKYFAVSGIGAAVVYFVVR
ncbi:MAG: hypothetical protein E7539_00570 [Ruminococcaceae bacterium]|nr:hypothetical protein [Oscillospiraceae bacterium]